MLVVYGLVSDPASTQRSLGINVNLWWGLVLLAFGVSMLGLATLGRAEETGRSRGGISRRQLTTLRHRRRPGVLMAGMLAGSACAANPTLKTTKQVTSPSDFT